MMTALIIARFHAEIKESLDRKTPDIVELHQDMTEPMSEIHHAVVQCMTTTLSELKRANTTVRSPTHARQMSYTEHLRYS